LQCLSLEIFKTWLDKALERHDLTFSELKTETFRLHVKNIFTMRTLQQGKKRRAAVSILGDFQDLAG